MPRLTPAGWFDQFPPDPAMDEHPVWCGRHWGPCPALGADGQGAATELARIWVTELGPKGSYSPAAMARKIKAAGRICCLAGDDRMFELWSHWLPASAPAGTDG
jgi:hypothetical protein